MAQPVSFVPVTPQDLDAKADPSLGSLNAKLAPLYRLANYLLGASGPVTLLSDVNMNGNSVRNIGPPVTSADALNQTNADPMYSTSTQQAAMEAVGTKMLQTTRRLNDGTQQHTTSSDLNTQGSIPPSNITGSLVATPSSTSISFAWTNIVIQLADGSYKAIRNSSLNVTGLAGGTTFTFYPYYDTKLGLLTFVADNTNATGVPPVAFVSSGYSPASQAQTSDTRVALTSGGFQASTGGSIYHVPLRTRT
jgi:hypothetical protein